MSSSDTAKSSRRPDPGPPPERVGPYRIESRIGIGGMGAVYRAFDERLSRWVAVKQILGEVADDPKVQARFRREARAAASLNHPSIVQIYDILETDEGDWIVMELIEGATLKEKLKRGILSVRQVLQLGREVAEGLVAAHARGVVHRDLKIENVMVAADGHAKILDFGLAKRLWRAGEGESVDISAHGAVMGTSRTMSPEQAMGLQIDHRSDLFSFGVLLYETLSGHSPFRDANPVATLTRICKHQHTPVRVHNPSVPEPLSAVVDHLLEKDPDARPQSAREVAAMLASIVAPLSGQITSAGWKSDGTEGVYLKTLVQAELVDVGRLMEKRGDSGSVDLLGRHDRVVRDLLEQLKGLEIEKAEGFLLLFDRPVDAVRWAVAYHEQLGELSSQEGETLRARVAIHLGEIFLRANPPEDQSRGAKPLEATGLAKLITARTLAIVGPGQTLLTQDAYDLSRRALGEDRRWRNLTWRAHGTYRLEGVDAEVRLYEVGVEGQAPLRAPRKGRRRGVADMSSTALDSFHPVMLRRRPWLLVAAVAALALASAGFFLWIDRPDEPPPLEPPASAIARLPSVAILGFSNRSQRPDADWLSTAFGELLATELADDGDLRLVAGETVARGKDALRLDAVDVLSRETLVALGQRLDANYVVFGSYALTEKDGHTRVDLELVLRDTAAGAVLLRENREGSPDQILELVAEISRSLRRQLGLEPTPAR